ncbi:hypothetical protein ACWCPS_33650 [Streptomyces mauvecolor]
MLLFFCMLTAGGLGIGVSGLLHWWRIAMSLGALAVGMFGLLGVVGWFVRLGEIKRERRHGGVANQAAGSGRPLAPSASMGRSAQPGPCRKPQTPLWEMVCEVHGLSTAVARLGQLGAAVDRRGMVTGHAAATGPLG